MATDSSLHDSYSPSDDALGVALDETASQSTASSTSSFTSENSGPAPAPAKCAPPAK